MQTPILVFDEPTASLDTREQLQFAQVLETLHQNKKTVLIISHDMDFLAENVDRIILIQQGKIVRDAPVHQFFEDEQLLDSLRSGVSANFPAEPKLEHPRQAVTVDQFLGDRQKKTDPDGI